MWRRCSKGNLYPKVKSESGVKTGDVAVAAHHEQKEHQREYDNGYHYFNDSLFPHNP